MIPFAARVRYFVKKKDEALEAVTEACVVLEMANSGVAGAEQRFICVTQSGRVVQVPGINLSAVVSPEWKKMMAEVELSATGETAMLELAPEPEKYSAAQMQRDIEMAAKKAADDMFSGDLKRIRDQFKRA